MEEKQKPLEQVQAPQPQQPTQFNPQVVAVQDSPAAVDSTKKPAGRKKFVIGGVILVIIAVLASAAWYLHDKSAGGAVFQKLTGQQLLYGHTIQQTNCTDLMRFAKDESLFQSSQSKYRCFKGTFTVDSEKITYASIQLTHEFEDENRSKCQVDCGSSIGDYAKETVNVGEFILRQNGSIEHYNGAGGGGVDSIVSELTGCGAGSTFVDNDKLQNGTLVIDNNKLGLQTKLSGLHVTDSFGNECTADLELVSYLSSSGEDWEATSSISIKSIAVQYELKEVSSCSSITTSSTKHECFTQQAVLRNDTSICDSLKATSLSAEPEPWFDDCIIAVAKRRKDPAVCDQIKDYREQYLESCQEDAKKLKVAFSKELTTK
jgi:hypothetical protein